MRPAAKLVLDWARAVPRSGLATETGLKVRADLHEQRARRGLLIRPGSVSIYASYPPFGGGVRRVRRVSDLVRDLADRAMVEQLVAAIGVGEVWERIG